jgi:hypothetical protein
MQLTVQKATLSGLDPAFSAADAAGDTFANTGREYLHVKNGSAGSITVTVDAIRSCNYGFDHNASAALPAGGERVIGPFERHRFGASPDITYTSVTSVTVAVVQIPG